MVWMGFHGIGLKTRTMIKFDSRGSDCIVSRARQTRRMEAVPQDQALNGVASAGFDVDEQGKMGLAWE